MLNIWTNLKDCRSSQAFKFHTLLRVTLDLSKCMENDCISGLTVLFAVNF